MAASNSSRSRGFEVEVYWWGYFAKGTRAELIKHGITIEAPFPGDPGEKKTVCNTIDPLGREIRIKRASKSTFCVYRDFSEEEKALIERREKREKELQDAKKLVDSWPKSANEFRNLALNHADLILGLLEGKLIDGYEGGYRLSDDDAARRFERLVDEMVDLIKSAEVVMDQELRDKYTPACLVAKRVIEDTQGVGTKPQCGGSVIPFRR